jgi:hypothetical protein
MKKIIATLFFLLAAIAAVFLVMYPKFKETKSRPKINSFEECVAQGYEVFSIAPRQCNAGGKNFVESFIPEK